MRYSGPAGRRPRAAIKTTPKQNAAPPPTPVNVVAARTTDAVYYDQYLGHRRGPQQRGAARPGDGLRDGPLFKEGDLVPGGQGAVRY
ncbi:MAG: hypothetical protein WKG07_36395 [Hymenobacter sp.]